MSQMDFWNKRVADDLGELPPFLDHYEEEYKQAKKDLTLKGKIEITSSTLPAILEHRFAQLQDIEAVLEHLNIRLRKLRSGVFKNWFENVKSARALSAKECERYVDNDDNVVALEEIINKVAFVRNLYLGLLKGLDNKSYQLNNISKLRAAGLDDAALY